MALQVLLRDRVERAVYAAFQDREKALGRLHMRLTVSADIFACDFDPSDVDSATGEISYEKVTVKEVPYIYYEYPLPPHLQFPPDDLVYTLKTIGSLEFLVRKHILIVHSGKFTDFLGELATQAELFFSSPA